MAYLSSSTGRAAWSATVLAFIALVTSACGDSDTGGAAAEPAPPVAETEVAVTSAVVKRSPAGKLITALRGTATPGATVTVFGRETTANADGTWALRTSYSRNRTAIAVQASVDGMDTGAASVRQPRRPALQLTSSTGVTTTSDQTLLKGRVSVSRGSVQGVRVTVNGQSASVSGSRWSLPVTVSKGTRRFTIKASRPGADGDTLSMTKTRKLSASEKAARRAAREAERQAKAAAREAERQARAAAKEAKAAAEAQAEACDPNYSGACLDPNSSDYDCSGGSGDGPDYVDGPVEVVGSDPFDLDRDGDGVGCES